MIWMRGFECSLSCFADDKKLSGSVDLLKGKKTLQRELDQWADQWDKVQHRKVPGYNIPKQCSRTGKSD